MLSLPLSIARSSALSITPLSALSLPSALGFGIIHGTINSVAGYFKPKGTLLNIITDIALIALSGLILATASAHLFMPLSLHALVSFSTLYFIENQCERLIWNLPINFLSALQNLIFQT